jgi:hypothetical protein
MNIKNIGGGVMKNNIIWVDFTAKNKSKSKIKPKGFLANILDGIRELFKPSSRYPHKPKLGDNYHKSIL